MVVRGAVHGSVQEGVRLNPRRPQPDLPLNGPVYLRQYLSPLLRRCIVQLGGVLFESPLAKIVPENRKRFTSRNYGSVSHTRMS